MKKLISILLVAVILMSTVVVFADDVAAGKLQEVLIKVKQKVEIPADFTKFSSYTSERTQNISYTFLWQGEDENAYIEVSADSDGRITSYYFYDNSLKSDKKLTKLSRADILRFSNDFLNKTVPEAFAGEDDKLIFDEESWSVNNMTYDLTYKRIKDGVEVKDNNASVRVVVYDDVAYIKNMNVSFKYDAEFLEDEAVIENYEEKYKEAFPIELIYRDEYQYYQQNENEKTVLIYRNKDGAAGYILTQTGETVTEDAFDEIFGGSGGDNFKYMESTNDATAKEEVLTEQELKELEELEGLISKTDAEKVLKKLPYIGFDSSLKLSHYSVNKENDRYVVVLTYEDEDGDRYISASMDGKTAELLSLYNKEAYNSKIDELTDTQINSANNKIDEFLKAASGEKYNVCALWNSESYGSVISRDYDRVVNGIRYIDDGIYVQFDAENGKITNYRLDFEEDREFDNPEKVINTDTAYDELLKAEPLKTIYLHTDGVYKKCFTVKKQGTELDAFTGKEYISPYINQSVLEYKYSDIEAHWANEKINKLAEVQIGFEGEKFNPDEPISQYDLLRLFAAGIRYRSYLDFSEDELYRILEDEDVITSTERNSGSTVKREDAFVYMIKLDGLDRIAKLDSIFKVKYADGHLVSDGKIGYPAILTGMNIICGDGGNVRPKDEITRAEAAVMVFNYMSR